MLRFVLPVALLLAVGACASTPKAAPDRPPTPAASPADVATPASSAPKAQAKADEDLAKVYARYISELTNEDVALGRLVIQVGESVGSAPTGADMVVREKVLDQLIQNVATLRAGHLKALDFWDRVKEQWPTIATLKQRAALDLLSGKQEPKPKE